MRNLSAKDLIGELILAAYESGYYAATGQPELVAVAIGKRKAARLELERRLTPPEQLAVEWDVDTTPVHARQVEAAWPRPGNPCNTTTPVHARQVEAL